jgi:hypothetical protein
VGLVTRERGSRVGEVLGSGSRFSYYVGRFSYYVGRVSYYVGRFS